METPAPRPQNVPRRRSGGHRWASTAAVKGARYFMRTKFDNVSKVAAIKCPKLFIHSRDDEVISFELGERLFAAAAEPKENLWFDRGGHNSVTSSNPEKYVARLRSFLSGISPDGK